MSKSRQAEADIIAPPAEIDIINASHVEAELIAAINAGSPIVVADLTATRFIDCTAAHALHGAHCHALALGTELRCAIPDPHVVHIMELTGNDELLHICPRFSPRAEPAAQRPSATNTGLDPSPAVPG